MNYQVVDLYAFWRYDLYPYVLGGKIDKMDSRGNVYAPRYARWFKPIKLLPSTAGKDLLTALERLEVEHRDAVAALNKTWDDILFKLLPEAKGV